MSETTGEVCFFDGARLAAVATVVAASGLLASSCTSEVPVPPTHSAEAPAAPAPSTDPYQVYDGLPDGPCYKTPLSDSEIVQRNAKDCLSAYAHGKIALVNFGVSPSVAQETATGMSKTISHASEGIVHPTVEVVNASPAAQKKLEQYTTPKGCIDASTPAFYASTVADETMPALRKDDFVIALNSMPACEKSIGGIADGEHLREAEVFVPKTPPSIPNLPPGAIVETTSVATIAAHEWFHLIDEGHDGTATGFKVKGQSGSDLNGNDPVQSPAIFDLKGYLETSKYEEYGSSLSPMGNGAMIDNPDKAILNPVQINALEWPEVALGDTAASRARPMTQTDVTLSENDARSGDYATVKLDESYTFSPAATIGGTELNTPHKFDAVEVVPVTDPNGYQKGVYGADIMLSDDGADTTDLGVIGETNPGEIKTWNISYGNQEFQIKINGETLQTRLMPHS